MRRWRKGAALALTAALCLGMGTPAKAATVGPGASNQTTAAVNTDSVAKPEIKAEGAVVIDASTGNVLYGKNEKTRFYPASTTKLMTAMLVLEQAGLGDTVTFSKTATTNLESGAVSLNLTEGDKLTVEQCLYALLLKSANEVGNGLAEHVGGSVSNFAQMMNKKAAELGCTGTNFVNPHGLNDNSHYTTPYDMALIGRAAFQNETLCKVATTVSYQLPATKKAGARTITMGHKMVYPNDSRYYPGIIGGKTGYTSLAGNTLVTGVQREGTRLIAVVMKSKSTHYEDTKALLDYGFAVMGNTGAGAVNGSGTPGVTGPGSSGSPGVNQAQGPGTAPVGWGRDDKGWYYIKENKSRAAGEWLSLGQKEYWIDSDGYMATGWRHFTNGAWYYFHSSGAMAVNYWVEDKGKWFYLGSDGAMLTNIRTPDGYELGADGAWTGK